MTFSQAKSLFWGGTLLSTVVFLVLTFNSLSRMPQRTHEDKLDGGVQAGKWAWQRHNCNDCHTILGIGGYYAPDLTKVMGRREPDWMARFLADPARIWPAKRKMPNLKLKEEEIGNLISFLTWVNGIDTNNWPPQPVSGSAEAGATEKPKGEKLFNTLGCTACHRIGGVGGTVGPDLTKVGDRRTKEWIEQQIRNPRSHNPNSIMPNFSRLSSQDIESLADYLSSLK
jgi:nitric oxide reductase subunit C